MPSNCLQADEQLKSLIQSTYRCFSIKNYPLNSVARRIKNDVKSLREVIIKLESERLQQEDDNIHQSSYSFSSIKAKITSDNKWCHY